MQRRADSDYAAEIRRRVDQMDRNDKEKEQKRIDGQNAYYKDITAQIKTEKQRKKYDILMTEHERRVNDRDIEAYREYN